MTLGERIQAHRKKAGLSQEQLAEQLGVSRQAVSKWELDGAQPELDKVVAMARLFRITTDELLLEEPVLVGTGETPLWKKGAGKWYLLGLIPIGIGGYLVAQGILALISVLNMLMQLSQQMLG